MKKEIVDLVKATPNILGQVYGDLAQPSVKAIGTALGTVFEFSTSFLLPVKLLNEKFRLNFTKRLNEYKEKLEKIPEEKRCEVHPQIGTPIIEKLSYTTNEEIADLFTTLLANASNVDMVNTAHPSFVNMLERMSPDEAKILKYLKDKNEIPYCDTRAHKIDGNGFIILKYHVTSIEEDVILSFPQNTTAYLSNFESLGVLKDMNGLYKKDEDLYNKIRKLHKLDFIEKELVPHIFESISIEKGYYKITDFGKLFISACVR